MNINWKIRFNRKNILFIAQVFISVVVPVLAYFGLNVSDMTTWGAVGMVLFDAIRNPYIIGIIMVSLFNAITDPTTKGISDSERALGYTEPGMRE